MCQAVHPTRESPSPIPAAQERTVTRRVRHRHARPRRSRRVLRPHPQRQARASQPPLVTAAIAAALAIAEGLIVHDPALRALEGVVNDLILMKISQQLRLVSAG